MTLLVSIDNYLKVISRVTLNLNSTGVLCKTNLFTFYGFSVVEDTHVSRVNLIEISNIHLLYRLTSCFGFRFVTLVEHKWKLCQRTHIRLLLAES